MEKTTINAEQLKDALHRAIDEYSGEDSDYARGTLNGLRRALYELHELKLMRGWTLNLMIREARKDTGLTQAEIARQIGISSNDLCNMELGNRKVSPEVWEFWVRHGYYSYEEFFRHENKTCWWKGAKDGDSK